MKGQPGESWSFGTSLRNSEGYDAFSRLTLTSDRPLRGAHRQFVVDLSVFCRRGLCPPLGIAGRSRLLQDCPAGATFPGAGPEKRRFYLCNFSAPCAHLVEICLDIWVD